MFDHVGPRTVPSRSRGVKSPSGWFALVALALGCALVIVITTRRHPASVAVAGTRVQPAAPSNPSAARTETEVEIGTEVTAGAWRVVPEHTHDVKDAGNAGIAPDQKDAVIFPGGELALAWGDRAVIADGPGSALSIYGSAGDNTPYTVFVRRDGAENWIHLVANRSGFPRGVGSHDLRQAHAQQIKIRNDGTTSLFVDAVAAVGKTAVAAPSLAARPRGETVAAARPAAPRPTETVTIEPFRAPITPASIQSDAAVDAPTPAVAVEVPPAPRANAPSTASGGAATGEPPNRRDAVSGMATTPRAALQPPQRTRSVTAVYPKLAQMANVHGTVVIEAIIDAGGKVVSPRILKSIPLLDRAALDAVTQSEFKPAMRDGHPVPVNVTLSVVFARP